MKRRQRTLNLDLDVVEMLDKLPWSTRSDFVNATLRSNLKLKSVQGEPKSKRWERMKKILDFLKENKFAEINSLTSKFAFELNLTKEKIREYLKTLQENGAIAINFSYVIDYAYFQNLKQENLRLPGSPEWFSETKEG